MSRTFEVDYSRALMARCAVEFPDYRFFRRNVGVVKLDTDRMFRAGIPGQCDLYVLGKGGWYGEVELKRYTSLSPTQQRWMLWCHEWSVPWICLKVLKEDKLSPVTLERWSVELREFLGKPCVNVSL